MSRKWTKEDAQTFLADVEAGLTTTIDNLRAENARLRDSLKLCERHAIVMRNQGDSAGAAYWREGLTGIENEARAALAGGQ